jgi:DNA-binding NarL/FixJ family response regulator
MAGLIRVVVVDDHPLFAQGTVEVLDRLPGIRAVGHALGLDEAVRRVEELEPDVVLCDVMLGDEPTGLSLPERLSATKGVWRPVIFLSEFASATLFAKAISAGASGYLRKTVEPDELRAAILAVAAGATVFPEAALHPAGTGLRQPSPREAEILVLVADGGSNSEVAARLGISDKTVETHLARLFARYGVASRTQLAIMADRHGWLRRSLN